MAVKKKEHEKLDDQNIELVIGLLEQEKPITQKEACERLNIAVNGARLKKIIQDYRDRVEMQRKLRAANRGKPATPTETITAIEQYLEGESLKNIADNLYRSTDFVKKIIEDTGVPQRVSGETYANFSALPESCMRESFAKGDFVWSSKYGGVAEIMADLGTSSDGISKVYQIWVFQNIGEIDGPKYKHYVATGGGFYANQPAYDLGALEHLIKLGVNVRRAIK